MLQGSRHRRSRIIGLIHRLLVGYVAVIVAQKNFKATGGRKTTKYQEVRNEGYGLMGIYWGMALHDRLKRQVFDHESLALSLRVHAKFAR